MAADLQFDPLDEYPIHQLALPMRYVGTSDRHCYDRCIYQGIDKAAEWYFITGLGVYPNLGVIDAFATVRHGDRQWATRTSGGRPEDKMRQEVGVYRIEVIEPFRRLRLVCEAEGPAAVGFDLTYESDYGPIAEPQHVRRQGDRILLDASRFAGVGTWTGELRVDGQRIDVTPDRFIATRDRSWGIRPVGEPEPAGKPKPFSGMWWCWVPLRFEEFALHVILEEDASGARSTNHAVRVWPAHTGRPPEQLGWPLPRITYRSGSRIPIRAEMDLTTRDGRVLPLVIEPRVALPLNVGCGYGNSPDWNHGMWKGDNWLDSQVYDHNDAAVTALAQYAVTDHLASATFDGQQGWGIFEHACIGPHAPSGFADFAAVAT